MRHIQCVCNLLFMTSWHIKPAVCFILHGGTHRPWMIYSMAMVQWSFQHSKPLGKFISLLWRELIHGYAWTKAIHDHITMLWHAFLSMSVCNTLKWHNACTFGSLWTKNSALTVGNYMWTANNFIPCSQRSIILHLHSSYSFKTSQASTMHYTL